MTALKNKTAGFGVRHFQMTMLFSSMIILYCIKVSMSIAIVAMTDNSQIYYFDWSLKMQSIILSSFEWGFILLKIPGAEAAARYGGKIVMIICTMVNSAATIVLPIAAYYGGWKAVCACRLVQGLAQGVLLPTLHNLISKWAPLKEQGRIITMLYAGGHVGMVLQLSTGGYIIEYWGWSVIFYLNGIAGVIWTIIYSVFGSSSPEDSKIISDKELLEIQYSLGRVKKEKHVKTPWRAMLNSLPFLSLIIVNIGASWGYWTFLTEIPTIMKKVHGVNIKANGLISALPYVAAGLLCYPYGFMSDYCINKKLLTINASRKIQNSISMFGPAILLIILSYVLDDIVTVIALLTISVGLTSGKYCGFHLVFLDMAPNHAATMLAISYSFANIVSIFAPLAAGFLIIDESSPYEWRKVFFLAAGMFAVGNVFYLVFGTSERQKWNDPPSGNDTE